MTKILLSGLVCLLFSVPVLACKPAPLTRTQCNQPSIQVNYQEYIRLLKGIIKYQKTLSSGIIYPQSRNSCFNNRFAEFYGMEFKHFMDAHKRLACREQIEVVKRSFQSLISDQSQEFMAVKSAATQADLRKQAVLLEKKIENVLSGI